MTEIIGELMSHDDTLEFAKFALERMDGHIAGTGMALFRVTIPKESALQKDFPVGSPEYVSQELWRQLSARMRAQAGSPGT